MRLLWEDRAWSDYLYWQAQDKKTLKRINGLIKDIQRNTFEGLGKPEPLKGNLSGMWSSALMIPTGSFTMRRTVLFILFHVKDIMRIEDRKLSSFLFTWREKSRLFLCKNKGKGR